jgi:RNA polymerase sigma-70 factor (ECF subfamily)
VALETPKHMDPSSPNWTVVVDQIRHGDPAGEETLYRVLRKGSRLFLRRRLETDDVDDRVHDLFVILVEAVRRGDVREPERFMGFVRTVLNRQLGHAISDLVRKRETYVPATTADEIRGPEPDPEQQAVRNQKLRLMQNMLRDLNERETEILTRSYIRQQTPDQIAGEMGLSTAQVYLVKSRAKARLADLVKRRITRRMP